MLPAGIGLEGSSRDNSLAMKILKEKSPSGKAEKINAPNDRKPGKSAHGKRGGEDGSSGGSRQGNAGHLSDDDGSFGNR
jgi:hypothetical protein